MCHLRFGDEGLYQVSGGYPGDYAKGKPISIAGDIQESIVFHAGTKAIDSQTVTNGGRVIAVTSYGKTMQDALDKSYRSIGKINFENSYYRNDIGFDLKP